MLGKTNAVVGDSTPQYQGSYNVTSNGTLATANKKMTQDLVVNVASKIDNLIDRSITSINSNVDEIGEYACYGCSQLITASFPNAIYIYKQSFMSCNKLKTASFLKAVEISPMVFYGCRKLNSLTFGANQICTLNVNSVFNNAGTQNDNPNHIIYIYVPSDLIESYKIATNWSNLYNDGRVDFLPITE